MTLPVNRPERATGTPARTRRRPARAAGEPIRTLTMRELGKLTAEQVATIEHPVPVTSNGRPVAWLVPMTASERKRAELIASGELIPRRRDLTEWRTLPPITDGPSLSEILLDMREQERT